MKHIDPREMNWISVEERLPEDKEMVLVYPYNVYVYDSDPYMAESERGKELWGTKGAWISLEGSYQGFDSVTHWMPLPETPTTEKETS